MKGLEEKWAAAEGGRARTHPNPSLGRMRLLRWDDTPCRGWLSLGWLRACRQAAGSQRWAQPWVRETRWEGEGSLWHCCPSPIPWDPGCRWAASDHPWRERAVPIPAVGTMALGCPSACRGLSGAQLCVESDDFQEELLLPQQDLLLQLQGLLLQLQDRYLQPALLLPLLPGCADTAPQAGLGPLWRRRAA